MDRNKAIIKTSILGIAVNIILVIFKAIIGIIVNSIAIILDAVNNLTDVLSSVITIVGTKLANKAPDKKHPYGHGRIEYFTSLIIGIIVLFAGRNKVLYYIYGNYRSGSCCKILSWKICKKSWKKSKFTKFSSFWSRCIYGFYIVFFNVGGCSNKLFSTF